MPLPDAASLVLGVDGGATSTVALLADATGRELGRGVGGSSNINAVGVPAALQSLDTAVEAAFQMAERPRAKVGAAVLGLAGVDLAGTDLIHSWADRVELAARVSVANDATLLFAAGTPEGWGLAIVAGTGSIAFTLDKEGKTARAGGWGYLLGDEGSAYRMGLLGIRAACRSADGITPPTKLLPALLAKFGITDPRDIIPVVYGTWDKAAIAGLAPLVLELARDDETAATILEEQALELAKTAAGAVANGNLPTDGIPIALTGGLLLRSVAFRMQFLEHLRGYGVTPGPVGLVEDPAIGAVTLAMKLLSRS
ncbi:MAG: BadF/BadG/BcrA/BcrD type ATPase [Planctomycetaceae bacterium]|nr:BadF/BadG/BcrA/BcrD type ATPase [Planctomycetaceae bacterium]